MKYENSIFNCSIGALFRTAAKPKKHQPFVFAHRASIAILQRQQNLNRLRI
nr:hypothetical protein [uncultured Campylobacter sp.]